MESRQLKAPALRALALAAVCMGFLALLTIPGVAAQGKDPGDGPADVSGEIEGLQDAVAGPKPSQRYPRLDSTLNGVVEDYEVRRSSARSAASQAPVHSASTVAVTIYLNANVAAVRSFLKNNGADPRNVGEDYIEAYVPVTLLGQLSQQPGVLRVEAIVGPKPVGVLTQPLGQTPPPTPTPDPCLTALGVLSDPATKTETQTGSWDGTCASEQRTGSHARYYSFSVEQDSSVTIDLTAPDDDSDGDPDTDTYLYLLEGARA